MPELPEVEVVRAGLARHVLGATIVAVEVLHPRPVRRDPRGSTGFVAALVGRRIEAARRRGKYLWLALDNDDALLGHLGMSGQVLLQHPGAPDERHLRVRFSLDGPDGPLEMRFVDQRMFGGLLVSTGRRAAAARRSPTSPATRSTRSSTTRRSWRGCAGVRRASSASSSTRRLISGVGNIYADEALWRAKVHGDRPGTRMTRPPGERRCSIGPREVMTAALGDGGTSFDALYVNVNGESGYFDRSLHAYGREGLPVRPLRRADPADLVHEPLVVLLPALPARPADRGPTSRRIDRAGIWWDS